MTTKEIKEEIRKHHREIRVLERELKKKEENENRAKEYIKFLEENRNKTVVVELSDSYVIDHNFQKCSTEDIIICLDEDDEFCLCVNGNFTCYFYLVKNIYLLAI